MSQPKKGVVVVFVLFLVVDVVIVVVTVDIVVSVVVVGRRHLTLKLTQNWVSKC